MERNMSSKCATSILDENKKNYQKMKKDCADFEQKHHVMLQRIGIDMGAFDIETHPDHPAEAIFQLPVLSDRDIQKVCNYLSCREIMYLLELCIRNIEDDDTRRIAEMYYLQRIPQPEIAINIGRSKSYISKKLDKAERNEMVMSIVRYLEWKYEVPGGKNCAWAGEWERRYMMHQDAVNHTIELPKIADMPWIKSLRRLGF